MKNPAFLNFGEFSRARKSFLGLTYSFPMISDVNKIIKVGQKSFDFGKFLKFFFNFLCVLANVFVAYCVTGGNINTQASVKIIYMSLASISIILTIAFSESRRLNQSFGSIHLLSIPICTDCLI